MPKIWPILAQGFTAVFTRLGIQAVPSGNQWFLSDTLIPVSLVDSDVTLSAVISSPAETISGGALLAAPAANTIAADTGALVAGKHRFKWGISKRDGVNNNTWALEHRDAANAADLDIWRVMTDLGVVERLYQGEVVLTVLVNERFRIRIAGAGGAGSEYSAWIQSALLPT